MPIRMRITSLLVVGLLAVQFFVTVGCDERDVEGILDADEIRRFIAVTEIGRDLFQTDSLIVPDPYLRPGDTTLYSDSVISVERTIAVDTISSSATGDQLADWGALGLLREGVATVQDRFTVVTRRLNIPGAPPDTTTRTLVRMAFFLKLFNDAYPFLGWDLWAFNGSGATVTTGQTPLRVGVTVENGAGVVLDQFRGDEDAYTISPRKIRTSVRFIEIRQIPVTTSGVRFILETAVRNTQSPARYYALLSGSGTNRISMQMMNQIDRATYIDTVFSPDPNPRLWNVMFIQAINDTINQFQRSWVIPYRVPQ